LETLALISRQLELVSRALSGVANAHLKSTVIATLVASGRTNNSHKYVTEVSAAEAAASAADPLVLMSPMHARGQPRACI